MTLPIQELFNTKCHAHLVGIGGVSMAPLAEVLHGVGISISGSDMNESESVRHLRTLGIPIVIGHHPQGIEGADYIIRTAAAREDNPEIIAARANNIPVFERAEAWGAIMCQYKNALCIAGVHGKTTTTSMCAHIFLAAQKDPTIMIGGTLPLIGASHRVGQGDTIILESCEYCNSFLSFFPTVAVILNVDADHLDFFKDLEDVQLSFRNFANLVPNSGVVVCNCEDDNTMNSIRGLDRPLLTFGVETGDVHAGKITWNRGFGSFDVIYQGQVFTHVTLNVPGVYNIKNALAAAAAAIALHLPADAIAEGLTAFLGVGRRFEYKGKVHGATIYDDYAHHPQELEALLTTTSQMGYRRVICAFQSHTYTRTQQFFHDFVTSLKLADKVIIGEIFPAREENLLGLSGSQMAAEIPNAIFCKTLDEVTVALRELAQEGDLILTVGAGDIYLAGEALVADTSTIS